MFSLSLSKIISRIDGRLYRGLIPVIFLLSSCSSQPPVKPEVQDAVNKTELSQTKKAPQQIDETKFRQGILALEENNLDKARRLFTEFSRVNPNLAGPLTNLALVHYKNGELDKALQRVNRAIEINPDQAQAYHLRAQLKIENRDINQAEKDFLKALQLKPDYFNAHYNLALLYDIYFQDIPLAIKHYERYRSLISFPDEATDEWIIHLKGTLENG